MAIETLVGLQVVDDEGYRTYREQMTPILKRYGGEIGYDFQISKVLCARTAEPMNRVFTISFPDQDSMDSFFSHHKYLQIKQQYFEHAVSATTIIAKYHRP